jgi:hypothetical protein
MAFLHENMKMLAPYGDDKAWNGTTIADVELALSDAKAAVAASQRVNCNATLRAFWAERTPASIPWGWKDPRNSLTFPVWKLLFPDARAVVIRKEVDKRAPRSKSGYWFRKFATQSTREAYMAPHWLHCFPDTLCVQFEEITADCARLNRLMSYCGLTQFNQPQFEKLLIRAGLER